VIPKFLLRCSTFVASIALLAAAHPLTTASATAPTTLYPGVTCTAQNIPVALSDGAPATAALAGELCTTLAERQIGAPIQVLVPGATYSGAYWDWPSDNYAHSYARAVAELGWAALALDRLGTGGSTRLASTSATLDADAFTVHEVIRDLGAGLVGGTRFGQVVLVGHSLGSVVAWVEAGTYRTRDDNQPAGVIITGLVHYLPPTINTTLANDIYPAGLDAKFAGQGLDDGWLTTRPPTTGVPGRAIFHNLDNTSVDVMTDEETLKDVVSSTEIGTFAQNLLATTGPSSAIQAPVLLILGTQDNIFCADGVFDCSSGAAVLRQEAPFYSSAPCLQAVVVAVAGHSYANENNSVVGVVAGAAWATGTILGGTCSSG
jgi:pimeloyl-ACP methyl ester carboxylesterase